MTAKEWTLETAADKKLKNGERRSALILACHKLAKNLGHEPGGWELQGKFSAWSRCKSCGLFANIDSSGKTEDGLAWGSCLEVECKGRYMTAPSWGRVYNEELGKWI